MNRCDLPADDAMDLGLLRKLGALVGLCDMDRAAADHGAAGRTCA
jgi:hypothetical protein